MVSVITIFYNPGSFIREAVESVLAQTYPDWELLLVNDGSTDGSPEIARDFEARHPGRIRCLQHAQGERRGMSAARNLGLQHARGEFISFLDADDVWLPHKLGEQTALLNTHPDVGLLFGVYRYWYSWQDGATTADFFNELCVAPETVVAVPKLALICYPLGTAAAPSMSDLMARRTAIEAIGGFENHFKGMYEDQAFLMKMYLSQSVFVSGSFWSLYRQHDQSCCSVTNQAGQYDQVRYSFLCWLETYLRDHPADRAIHKALAKRLFPYRHPHLDRSLKRLRRLLRRSGLKPLAEFVVRFASAGTTQK